MKKLICLMAVLLFLLAGCSKQETAETQMSPSEIAAAILDSQSELPTLTQVCAEDEDFSVFISDYYSIPTGLVADGAIHYADGVEASEIAVLVLNDEKEVEAVRSALEEYRQSRASIFEGYAPQQAAMAGDGKVIVNGKYVALLICPDTAAAQAAFLNCFGAQEPATMAEPTPTPTPESSPTAEPISTVSPTEPVSAIGEESALTQSEEPAVTDTDGSYNAAAILQAWQTGDDSGLQERNRDILQAAKDVIEQEITEDMSDYEKELAIHDWLTGWASFSMNAFGRTHDGEDTSDSDDPYGVLIGQVGNCWGYSSTFQLFMDMLEIPCLTVLGDPNSSGVEHAWNMVQLDGDWYCVDAAWDDPIGGGSNHRYFNRTSEEFRNSGIHHWDESSVPEATGTKYSYDNQQEG